MTQPIAPEHACLILDTCCVVTLAASGRLGDIVVSLGMQVAIAEYVVKVELDPPANSKRATNQIDLQPLIDSGLIQIVDLVGDAEYLTFITFSSDKKLDDGEAATSAIAMHRGWAIASDDRPARSALAQFAPLSRLLSTPDLVYHWTTQANPTAEELRVLLNRIRSDGHYAPPSNHPLAQWWVDHS